MPGSAESNPQVISDDETIAVGIVVGPWGLKGELKVAPLSKSTECLNPDMCLYAGVVSLTVSHSRLHKAHVIVKFDDVSDRESAEKLRGATLTVPATELPLPPEGAYYEFDIIGLNVLTKDGESLGLVSKILETGANDVYVVEAQDGSEMLIPAIRDVVKQIDISNGYIIVELLPGL